MLHHTGFLIIEEKKCHYLKKIHTYLCYATCTAEGAEQLGKGGCYLDWRKIKPHLRFPSAHPDKPVYATTALSYFIYVSGCCRLLKIFFCFLATNRIKNAKGVSCFSYYFFKEKRNFYTKLYIP